MVNQKSLSERRREFELAKAGAELKRKRIEEQSKKFLAEVKRQRSIRDIKAKQRREARERKRRRRSSLETRIARKEATAQRRRARIERKQPQFATSTLDILSPALQEKFKITQEKEGIVIRDQPGRKRILSEFGEFDVPESAEVRPRSLPRIRRETRQRIEQLITESKRRTLTPIEEQTLEKAGVKTTVVEPLDSDFSPKTRLEKRVAAIEKAEQVAAERGERARDIFRAIPGLRGDGVKVPEKVPFIGGLSLQQTAREVLAAPVTFSVGLGEQLAISGVKAELAAEQLFKGKAERRRVIKGLKTAARQTPGAIKESFDPGTPAGIVGLTTLVAPGAIKFTQKVITPKPTLIGKAKVESLRKFTEEGAKEIAFVSQEVQLGKKRFVAKGKLTANILEGRTGLDITRTGRIKIKESAVNLEKIRKAETELRKLERQKPSTKRDALIKQRFKELSRLEKKQLFEKPILKEKGEVFLSAEGKGALDTFGKGTAEELTGLRTVTKTSKQLKLEKQINKLRREIGTLEDRPRPTRVSETLRQQKLKELLKLERKQKKDLVKKSELFAVEEAERKIEVRDFIDARELERRTGRAVFGEFAEIKVPSKIQTPSLKAFTVEFKKPIVKKVERRVIQRKKPRKIKEVAFPFREFGDIQILKTVKVPQLTLGERVGKKISPFVKELKETGKAVIEPSVLDPTKRTRLPRRKLPTKLIDVPDIQFGRPKLSIKKILERGEPKLATVTKTKAVKVKAPISVTKAEPSFRFSFEFTKLKEPPKFIFRDTLVSREGIPTQILKPTRPPKITDISPEAARRAEITKLRTRGDILGGKPLQEFSKKILSVEGVSARLKTKPFKALEPPPLPKPRKKPTGLPTARDSQIPVLKELTKAQEVKLGQRFGAVPTAAFSSGALEGVSILGKATGVSPPFLVPTTAKTKPLVKQQVVQPLQVKARPLTDTVQRTRTGLDIIQRPAVRQRVRILTRQKGRQKTRQIARQRARQVTRQKVRQIARQKARQVTRQKTRQVTRQKTRQITRVPVRPIVGIPPPVPPFIPLVPPPPPLFLGDKKKKKKKKKGKKRKARFKPSLVGLEQFETEGISVPKVPRVTGLGVRPVVRKKRRKRR